MNKKPLRIILADIKHASVGIHSSYMPIGIGYIGSYALSRLGKNNSKIKMFTDPHETLECIDTWKPHIIGMANYCWNSKGSYRILRYAKKINPNVVCLAGGPDLPGMCDYYEYMKKHSSYLDFYAYKEGEDAFADLVIKIASGAKLVDLKCKEQTGMLEDCLKRV